MLNSEFPILTEGAAEWTSGLLGSEFGTEN